MGLDAYYGDGRVAPLAQQVPASSPPQVTPASAPSTPIASSRSPASSGVAATPAASAAQVAAANQAAPASAAAPAPFVPKGIQQFAVAQGDSFWALLARQNQSVADKNALSDDNQLKQNLGATPWLDQQAFGNRAANTPCRLDDMPIGGTVTLLDSHRLDDLNQQRQALNEAQQSLSGKGRNTVSPDERAAMLAAIVKPIVDEIDYATSGTGVVSRDELDALVAPIAARAPNDPMFQSAVNQAKQQVLGGVPDAVKTQVENATLDSGVVTEADIDKALAPIAARAPKDAAFQKAIADAKQQALADMKQFGRTPDQLGSLLKDAASGNTAQLQGDLQAQLYSVGKAAEKDSPDDLVAASTAIDTRAGVYATYLGADAKKLLQDARAAATRQVTVEQPAQSVVDAYNSKGGGAQGAAAAAARLHQLTDPTQGGPNSAKITPAQVQAIMDQLNRTSVKPDDPHSVFKTIVDGLTKGMSMKLSSRSPDYKAAQAGMNDLAAAMQTLHDTDAAQTQNGAAPQGKPGKAIVDQVASELYASIEANPDANEAVTREPKAWFADSAKSGNVALSASIAAQCSSAKQNAADSIALALQSGLKAYQDDTLTPLGKAIAADYAVFDMGSKGYGNLKSPAGQDAMKARLQGLPGGDKMTQDDTKLQEAQRHVGEVQWTLQDYATQIGWQKGGDSKSTPALQEFGGLMSAVDELDKAAGMQSAHDAAANIAQTQHWWQDRVGVGVVNQLAKTFGNKAPALTSNGTAQSALAALLGSEASGKDGAVRKALSPGLMGPLFLINAADTASGVGDPTLSGYGKGVFTGFAALYAGVGVSMTLDAVGLKASMFGATADGKAATPMRNLMETALEKIDAKNLSSGAKLAYKTAVSSVLENFSDVLGPVVAGLGVAHYLDTDGSDPAHATAFGLATVSDLVPTLAKQVLSNATKDTLENIGLDFLARTTEEGWTGIGLAGNVLAAAVQYGANQYDKAHAGDKELTDYLRADGVKEAVAEPFARHMTTLTSGKDAGAFLTAYFRSQGKSDADMIDWMNSIEGGKVDGSNMTAGDKADEIATFAKVHDVGTDKDGHYVIDTPGTMEDFQALLKRLNVRLS